MDRPSAVRIQEVIDETPTVRTLVFSDDVMSSALPGQFAMVWVPGAYELPMSIMVAQGGRAAFTVRRHGPASTALYGVRAGQTIAVRGPYGNSFDLKRGRLLLAGGGTGLVPLMRLLSRTTADDRIVLLMGARTSSEVFFDEMASDMIRKNNHPDSRVVVSTDDGTRGIRGRVTDALDGLLAGQGPDQPPQGRRFDAVYTCGPEPMMYGVVRSAAHSGIFAQASLERMMKCGAGICGSCVAGSDVVCRDGTVFDSGHLLANSEFGLTYRDKSGAAVRW